ncbi:Uncharacterized protein FWK35_00012692, partial [Aphis craccivora]
RWLLLINTEHVRRLLSLLFCFILFYRHHTTRVFTKSTCVIASVTRANIFSFHPMQFCITQKEKINTRAKMISYCFTIRKK